MPTFVEMYARGNIVEEANQRRRSLNIHGLNAFDLRTTKPSGEPWDFSLAKDRAEAFDYVKTVKPTWVIATHALLSRV